MKVQKFHYECNDCGAHYQPDELQYLCPVCAAKNTASQPPKGVLKTVYNYK